MATSRRVVVTSITTPLDDGPGALVFRRLTGTEELSRLYALEVDVVSRDPAVDPKALLGRDCTVAVDLLGEGGGDDGGWGADSGGARYLHGLVTRFGMREGREEEAEQVFGYRMLLRPWLWLATQHGGGGVRVFEDLTVPDIVARVLGPYGQPMAMDKLTRGYRRRPCTVQYRETDFNFISRLCEGEGIYWFYEHQAGSHRVVFADDAAGSHGPLPGGHVIPFHLPPRRQPHHAPGPAGREQQEQHVFYWTMGREMEPDLSDLDRDDPGSAGACDGSCGGDCGFSYRGAAYCLCFFSGGHNGKKKPPPPPGPALSSFSSSLGMDSLAGGGQQHVWGGKPPGDGGAWTGRGTGSSSGGESNRLRWPLESKRAVRHRTATVSAVRADAQLNKRSIAPGYTVVLRNHPQEDQNRQYLVVAVDYQLEENPPLRCSPGSAQAERSGGFELGTSVQRFAMEVHPTSVPYRPEAVTPRPQLLGPQLAVVVAVEAFIGSGPAHGGRVKVRFCEGADGGACALGRGEAGGCGCFALPQGGMAEGYTSSWAPVMGGGFSRGHGCSCAGTDGLPGVGTQVVVEFLQGHPERPIVVGCLCDGEGVRTARG